MPINTDDILVALEGNPHTMVLMRYVRPFIPALARKGSQETLDKFVQIAAKQKWNEVYALVWPLMTDDERDSLSNEVLIEAQNMVDNLKLGEDILKQLLLKVVQYLIGQIVPA